MHIKMSSVKWRSFCICLNVTIRPIRRCTHKINASACAHFLGDMNQVVEITGILFSKI